MSKNLQTDPVVTFCYFSFWHYTVIAIHKCIYGWFICPIDKYTYHFHNSGQYTIVTRYNESPLAALQFRYRYFYCNFACFYLHCSTERSVEGFYSLKISIIIEKIKLPLWPLLRFGLLWVIFRTYHCISKFRIHISISSHIISYLDVGYKSMYLILYLVNWDHKMYSELIGTCLQYTIA